MGDMDINTILRSGRHSKLKLYRNFTYWFCKHYFGRDIHPDMAMEDTVRIAHNGLGCVINKDAVIAENVVIQHHVTIGREKNGVPVISEGVYIGAYAIVLGKIKVGKNAIIGAGCVVTKNVPDNAVAVGNPMRIIAH